MNHTEVDVSEVTLSGGGRVVTFEKSVQCEYCGEPITLDSETQIIPEESPRQQVKEGGIHFGSGTQATIHGDVAGRDLTKMGSDKERSDEGTLGWDGLAGLRSLKRAIVTAIRAQFP